MTVAAELPPSGWWTSDGTPPAAEAAKLKECVYRLKDPVYLLKSQSGYAVACDGQVQLGGGKRSAESWPLVACALPLPLRHLGDAAFLDEYGMQYPYLAGAMAHGISSAEMVEAMGRNGMMGFFGSAGMSLQAVEATIERLSDNLGERPYGCNLIHSPGEPGLEEALVDVYLRKGLRLLSASAYLALTLPLVRYRVHGIYRDASGRIVTPNHVFAKVSRTELASQFFSPPPERFLRQLVERGDITEEQAKLAEHIPMAQNLTAEADSGGHTDNRPAMALIPTMLALRDRMQARYNYHQELRVGAAGGIATPASTAAAFAMGAAYVMTGSVNQACRESGSSDIVRRMLADAQQADIVMAPAADMFEMGVKVQVLKRGTMFAMRAAKLYNLYRTYATLDDIPLNERTILEQKFFRKPLEMVWEETREFFLERGPAQLERAERDPGYKMALVFRSYLGQASHWANRGETSRKIDFQIWCGPAMGAFNEWTKGTFLEDPANRRVVTVALNLLYGAGIVTRLNSLRMQGARLAVNLWNVEPLPQEELLTRIAA
ncbi:2-nitropropane dioxygenase [candidate division KSB3 bacterium]|uniref:2-nitropropane dioxygenase n=1 Tax=candidate division KSB3 bacterium TaxID=2044937 RepID=A0A2G6E1V9_9BACT|nr:MAG: 2-nitropropane dioxygenase [candidate division KSB3 bacterium]PIE28793.1 MAG: 2-nitropropane dioxygenase [candidate division KSB3 bacterium]